MDADAQETLFNGLKELAQKAQETRLTFLLVGRTGVGKSSTINNFFKEPIAPIGDFKRGTIEVMKYDRLINGIPCRIIDTPGLCDVPAEFGMDKEYLEEIKKKISSFHCMWFVTRLDEHRVSADEQNAIKWITTILGEQSWNYGLIVFTHANNIKPAWKFADTKKKRSERIRAEISKYTGWSIARNITSVAVDNLDEMTLDGQRWLPELYTQIWKRIHPNGAASYFFATAALKDELHPEMGLRFELDENQCLTVRTEMEQKLISNLSNIARAFIGFYLSSAPIGAAGMCIAGPTGFGVALAGNAVVWTLIGLFREPSPP